MKTKSIEAWLSFWQSYCQPSARSLERCQLAVERLQLQRQHCPIITVTGTNGKGSTIAALSQFLQAAGLKIGVLTSPHLIDFNERIMINGEMVSDQQLDHAFNQLLPYVNTCHPADIPSLTALYLFKQVTLDVIILEVGLGGRYDVCNFLDSDLLIITTIGLDHQALLGPDRESIAREKAALMRRGQSVIVGEIEPPKALFSQARAVGAQLKLINRDFYLTLEASSWQWRSTEHCLDALPYPAIPVQNAATAIFASSIFLPRVINHQSLLKNTLQKITLAGRFEILQQAPRLIIDVAHNAQACDYLSQQLKRLSTTNIIAIWAMADDKEPAACVRELVHVITEWHVTPLMNRECFTGDQLAALLRQQSVAKINVHDNLEQAWLGACQHAQDNDTIIAFGSFNVVVAIKRFWQNQVMEN